MAEEKNQVTDDESVELGSTIQLSPHAPTNKIKVECKGKDGTEYVSLDDVYEVNGNESLNIIAENCRQYMASRKLNKNGFSALMISGSESFVPGYDVMNGIKGGESFFDALKKGFVIMIKAIKRIIVAIVEWIILKLRSFLGFEKTTKELEIIRTHSENVKTLIGALLTDIMPKGQTFNWAEYNQAMVGDLSDADAFAIVRGKAKSLSDQMEAYVDSVPDIKVAEEELRKAVAVSKTVQSRYRQAVAKLRNASKNGNVGNDDIVEFVTFINEEVGINMNFNPIRAALIKLMDKIADVDVKGLFMENGPSDAARQGRDILLDKTKVAVSLYDREKVIGYINKVSSVLASPGFENFDPAVATAMKDLIDVKDAEFIDELGRLFPKMGEVRMTYMTFSNTYKNFVNNINRALEILAAVKTSIANMTAYANKADRIMLTYMSRDIAAIAKMDETELNAKMYDLLHPNDGGTVQERSVLLMDYDSMFADKHPWYHALVHLRRDKAKEFLNKNKIFKKIDDELAKLGIKGIMA